MLYIVRNQGNFYKYALRNYGKKNQCPLLDLKYKRDYRVVVAAMTLSKLLRINCLGMEITLILCVYVCVYYIYIYCYILHSTKENVSKACNDGMMRHDVWIKDFYPYTLTPPCTDTVGSFHWGDFLSSFLHLHELFIIVWCLLCDVLLFHLVAFMPCAPVASSVDKLEYLWMSREIIRAYKPEWVPSTLLLSDTQTNLTSFSQTKPWTTKKSPHPISML